MKRQQLLALCAGRIRFVGHDMARQPHRGQVGDPLPGRSALDQRRR